MTVEELRKSEVEKLQKAYDKQYDKIVNSLVSLAKDIIHDSVYITDKKVDAGNLKSISDSSLEYLLSELFSELRFKTNNACTLDYLKRELKELDSLEHDLNYLEN